MSVAPRLSVTVSVKLAVVIVPHVQMFNTDHVVCTAPLDFAANYVNIIGVPLVASGSCSAGKVGTTPPTYDPCDPSAGFPYEISAEANQSIDAGWRFKDELGAWQTVPCAVWSTTIPTSGICPYGLSMGSVVSVADSNGIAINNRQYSRTKISYVGRQGFNTRVIKYCTSPDDDPPYPIYDGVVPSECVDPCTGLIGPGYQDTYQNEVWEEGQNGTARAIPNLTRDIIRMNDDYSALWIRFTFPQVKGTASRTCTDGATTITVGGEVEVYPSLGSSYLGVVTNATSPVEDCFADDIYCSTSAGKSKSYTKSYTYQRSSPCVCPPSGTYPDCPSGFGFFYTCTDLLPDPLPPVTLSESISLAFPTTVGALPTYQGHANPEMRYLGSWVNPHWGLAYFRADWDVDGSPTSWTDYWGPIKEQWQYNAALVSPPRTRNSMISSPLQVDNGNTPFLDEFFGGYRWIGTSRWQVLETTIPSTITLDVDKPGEWTATNCTRSLGGGGITLSAFSGSTGTVELNLGSWATAPYLALLLAKQIAVNWGSNVDSMRVSLVGADGVEKELATAPGTYSVEMGGQRKYAGSWAIDNGAGVVSDTGTDTKPSGVSSTWMSDSELATYFELGTGKQFAKLKFVVTPTNPANPVTINWPVFTLWATHPDLWWENAKCCSMLWPDGVDGRWGNELWYDPDLGFQNPPLVAGMGTANTVIDALAYHYRVLQGNGGADLAATITADCALLYDAYEGQSISVVDKFSCSFILPKGTGETIRFALINSFSEVPPLACFPFKQRDTGTWLPTGSYAQTVYDLVKEERYLISKLEHPAKLLNTSNTEIGSLDGASTTGWYVWMFKPVLDNTETGWKVDSNGQQYASVRPWHGWFCLLAGSPVGAVWHWQDPLSRLLMVSYVFEGDVKFKTRKADLPIPGWDTDVTVTSLGTVVSARFEREQRTGWVYVLIGTFDGTAYDSYIATSPDRGETWTVEHYMADVVLPSFTSCNNEWWIISYSKYVSGTSGPVRGYIRTHEPGQLSGSNPGFSSPVVMSYWNGTSHVPIDWETVGNVQMPYNNLKLLTVVGVVDGETDESVWYSTDFGDTWTRA